VTFARATTPELAAAPLLAVNNLRVVYGGAIEALRDVSFQVPPGQIVALLGANGAGKSTVLKAASGILDAEEGAIEKGEIRFAGAAIERQEASRIVAMGLVHVPEGRRLFASMTVDENLTAGGHHRTAAELAERREHVYRLFPALKPRRNQISGYLSGGEQQMVALGRALMSRPALLALDEPSLGLAPLIVNEIFEHVQRLCREEKLTILLVEQNAAKALAIADYAYIMENGRVVMDGTAQDLRANSDVREFYLGMRSGETRSMRDVKHYKRRKRWLS
jgi:branched-chain amino acid transport system ATP-binding protein